MKLGDPLDCGGFELRNALLHLLATTPASAKEGQLYYKTGVHGPFYNNGTGERPLDAAFLTDNSIQNSALQTNPLLRSNHTGTQASSTIFDLATVVQAFSLDKFAAAAAAVNFGTQRVTNIATATNATDAARWDQVQAFVSSTIQGRINLKDPVRLCAAGTGLSLSGLAAQDGVTPNDGDRIAVINMGTANAIYVAHAGAWSLALDSANGNQWGEGTEFLVNEGTTYAGAVFRQTASGTLTIGSGSNPLVFTQSFKINAYAADGVTTALTGQIFSTKFDPNTLTTGSGALGVRTDVFARKFSYTLTCDGQNSNFNVTHNLGTTDVVVGVRDANGSKVFVDDNPANSSAVTIGFGSVMPSGTQYRVTVLG